MARKRLLYVVAAVTAVLVCFLLIGLSDLNGDHVNGFAEWFKYGTGPLGPFTHHPALEYSVDKGMVEPSLVKLVLPLDTTEFNNNDRYLIDTAANIPDMFPANVRQYYNASEIQAIQSSLLSSVLADGKVSDQEVAALRSLNDSNWTARWWIVRDIYKSGMINDANLGQDWDGDSISNFKEIMQGTNPLNKLEVSPGNLSQRFVIIAAPLGSLDNLRDIPTMMQELKKNGYDDNNVFLMFNPGDNSSSMYCNINNLAIKPDYVVKSQYDQNNAVTFLNYVKNLPSDGNDQVLIYTETHGNANAIGLGEVGTTVSEYQEALNQMHYGEAINVVLACDAGAFVKQFTYPNMLMISCVSANGSSGLDFSYMMNYLNNGLSVKDAFDRYAALSNSDGLYPVMYSNRDEPFMNPLVYTHLP